METSDYFMLRIRRDTAATTVLVGLIERLTTGEKRSFDSGDELLRLVTAWPDPVPKMPGITVPGNAAAAAPAEAGTALRTPPAAPEPR